MKVLMGQTLKVAITLSCMYKGLTKKQIRVKNMETEISGRERQNGIFDKSFTMRYLAKWQIAVIYAVIATMLLFASFALPWFGMHYEHSYSGENGYYSEYGYGIGIGGGLAGISAGGVMGQTSLYTASSSTSTVFWTTFILIFIALTLCILMTIFMIFFGMKKIVTKKLSIQMGVVALILCLLTPIIFAVALPSAIHADAVRDAENSGETYKAPSHDNPTKSFFGSYTEKEGDSTTDAYWGGDIGWMLPFISVVAIFYSLNHLSSKPLRFCPTCGKPLQEDWTICGYCGRTLVGKTEEIRDEEETPEEEMEMISESEISEGKLGLLEKPMKMITIKCPSCQHVMEVKDTGERPLKTVCPKCGAKGTLK
ncbi:MAG: zinc ribbon domain-containing protein [Actinobacteria bacterium]|nr:zinc ribbon domain-containing protein [Actinomycetota bacterium]MCG2717744.1 zinc-ribbon domain-containing protein [Nanoarchaeota archaeon]